MGKQRVAALSAGWLLIEGLEPYDLLPARILQSKSERWTEGQVVVWKDRHITAHAPHSDDAYHFIHESQVIAEIDPAMLAPLGTP